LTVTFRPNVKLHSPHSFEINHIYGQDIKIKNIQQCARAYVSAPLLLFFFLFSSFSRSTMVVI